MFFKKKAGKQPAFSADQLISVRIYYNSPWNARKNLTHPVALFPAFKGGVKERRSSSTLSKSRHLRQGGEGLTCLRRIYRIILRRFPSSIKSQSSFLRKEG
jgi:hypothetical protein